jgi:hypothetical protein
MKLLDRRFTLDDSEPLPVSLLRAPAAVASGAFVLGMIAGAIAGPFASVTPSPLTYLITLLVCLPFILPTAWYRSQRGLWIWMAAAATFATARAVFMAGFLLPHQPVGVWLLKTAMDLLAVAVLWVAAFAVKRPVG